MVPKPDGFIHVCIDFRKLNAVSSFDAYTMPHVEALLNQVGKATYLSRLDLAQGDLQISLREADKEKTAFLSPTGLDQFTQTPFGLRRAAAIFQRLVDKVLQPVS